jgi:hypothetical protein
VGTGVLNMKNSSDFFGKLTASGLPQNSFLTTFAALQLSLMIKAIIP